MITPAEHSLPVRRKYYMVADAASGLLLLLFLYTALSKLAGYQSFTIALKSVPVIYPYAGVVAWLLPAAELIIALLLFFRGTRQPGLYASLVALLAFTGYLLYMVAYIPDLPCNCGGVLNSLSWKQHIFFNLLFIIINISGLWSYTKIKYSKKRIPP